MADMNSWLGPAWEGQVENAKIQAGRSGNGLQSDRVQNQVGALNYLSHPDFRGFFDTNQLNQYQWNPQQEGALNGWLSNPTQVDAKYGPGASKYFQNLLPHLAPQQKSMLLHNLGKV